MEVGDVVQFMEHLASIQGALGSDPHHHITWWYTRAIPASGRWRKDTIPCLKTEIDRDGGVSRESGRRQLLFVGFQ